MVKLFCALVGAAGSAFPVDIDVSLSVGDLKEAIKTKKPSKIKCDANELHLFLATKGNAWLPDDDPVVLRLEEGEIHEDIQAVIDGEKMKATKTLQYWLFDKSRMPEPSTDQIHVLVVIPTEEVVPVLPQQVDTVTHEDVIWYGTRGSIVTGEGIDLEDPRTLPRITLTTDIIRRLEETHVLLVKSPPMTGKTSLAALVSRSLVERHMEEKKKMVVINFSALAIPNDSTFEEVFRKRCMIDWSEATLDLPASGCTVYLVLDETQVIYKDGTSSPRRKSTVFWELVKFILSNAAYSIRVLMFAAYGSGVEYSRLATPIQFDERIVLGSDQLNFSQAEVSEYVIKWFKGKACFDGLSSSAMEEFCANLVELTGGHVGLCATAIHTLNEVYVSRNRSASDLPSPAEWIRMLQSGSLYQANDNALFEAMTSTRAVKVLKTLDTDKLDRLERIAYGASPDSDADIVEQCLRKGILAQTGRRFAFSSPVMWRFFVKMRVGNIVRALHVPQTLPEMIARVVRAIDYESISQTLGRSLSSDIPLERAWQMEFYKAAYRCTPSTFVTSVDVGALFGSSGFVDFTIHGGDFFWGIEFLREASNLAEHIERFAPGGRYSSLGLTEFCLIDFRRIASIDDVAMERIAADMLRCENLFVVCYDARMAGVVVFNSAMDVVYRVQPS